MSFLVTLIFLLNYQLSLRIDVMNDDVVNQLVWFKEAIDGHTYYRGKYLVRQWDEMFVYMRRGFVKRIGSKTKVGE